MATKDCMHANVQEGEEGSTMYTCSVQFENLRNLKIVLHILRIPRLCCTISRFWEHDLENVHCQTCQVNSGCGRLNELQYVVEVKGDGMRCGRESSFKCKPPRI